MEGIIYRKLYDEDGAIISLDEKTLFKVPDVPRYESLKVLKKLT